MQLFIEYKQETKPHFYKVKNNNTKTLAHFLCLIQSSLNKPIKSYLILCLFIVTFHLNL